MFSYKYISWLLPCITTCVEFELQNTTDHNKKKHTDERSLVHELVIHMASDNKLSAFLSKEEDDERDTVCTKSETSGHSSGYCPDPPKENAHPLLYILGLPQIKESVQRCCGGKPNRWEMC